MRKSAFLIGLAINLIAPSAFASTTNTVNISNNGDNSTNHVVVNSDTSASNTSSSKCHTEVHMDNNGEKKDYESDDCSDVDMKSTNGNNSVHISNSADTDPNSVDNDSDDVTSTPNEKITPTISPTPMHIKVDSANHESLLDVIIDFGKKCVSILLNNV